MGPGSPIVRLDQERGCGPFLEGAVPHMPARTTRPKTNFLMGHLIILGAAMATGDDEKIEEAIAEVRRREECWEDFA